MKETLKKYSKYVVSLAILCAVMVMPVIASAQTWEGPLQNVNATANMGSATSLTQIIGAIIGTVIAILGVILVVIILYAGFMWMTSQGDPAKVKKAKDMIMQAVVGLLIVFAAYAITNFVMTSLTDISDGQTATIN